MLNRNFTWFWCKRLVQRLLSGLGERLRGTVTPSRPAVAGGAGTLQPQEQMGTALAAPCRPHLLGRESEAHRWERVLAAQWEAQAG